MNKLRIGVLMGGRSQEREVSLNSGRTVCDHLDTSLYTVVPLFQTIKGQLYLLPWHFLHRGKTTDFEHRLESEAQSIRWDDLKTLIDFVYIAQHGRYAEDGSLQGLFEMLQIPYFGSKVFASALGMDKAAQRTFLRAEGIEVPSGIVVSPDHPENFDSSAVRYPCIVKPTHEGSSLGVSVVHSADKLLSAIDKAMTITPGVRQKVLVEEYIQGLEFSCIVIFDYVNKKYIALPPSEIELVKGTEFFDYEQKYMPGKAHKYTPARTSKEALDLIQQTCIKTMQALGITTIGRIDGFLTPDNRVIIIDPNTFCGMDPSSFAFLQAAEINMSNTQLINHLIQTELYNYGMLQDTSHQFFAQNKSDTKQDNRVRVAVIMGGRSNEREISLASGRNIAYKLAPDKYQALPLFLNSKLELYKIDQRLLVRNTTAEIEAELSENNKIAWNDLSDYADFVFLGLHGGEGENGCIQGMLESLGIPFNGSSVLASALCMDKFKTCQLLRFNGIDVPCSVLVAKNEWQENKEVALPCDYPLIVKPHDDGCSVLVHKAANKQELESALSLIFNSGKHHALIEEYICGIELTVGVIGNHKAQALPPSMAVANAGILSIEEKFLPGAGENQTPAPLPSDSLALVKATIEDAYTVAGCKGYARIDCFYQSADISPTKKERVIILEINTLPGMTPATCIFHQAAEIGLRPMDFIDLIIRLGFEEHAPDVFAKNNNPVEIDDWYSKQNQIILRDELV